MHGVAYFPATGNLKTFQAQLHAYLQSHPFQVIQVVREEQPIKQHWIKRRLYSLLYTLKPDSHLLVAEPTHLTCSLLQVLEILQTAASHKIHVHFMKYGIILDNASPLQATQALVQLINQIQTDFVSHRTTLALARRRAAGLPLGRPKGCFNKSLKLDQYQGEIERYLSLGINKASIAKLVDCHPQTLYDWLDRRKQVLMPT
jgi:DNA invertase Pin-like site-specific DNA recombinase